MTEDALQTMIHEYRSSYRENSKAIETIENFAREYRSEDALQWYLKKTFLYRMTNKALKVKNIDQLHVLRCFMKDLTQCFIREHRKLIETGKEKLIVYRGMKLSRDQIGKFTENLGQLISTNGILITTSDRLTALNQVIFNQKNANLCSILLKIECDLLHINGVDIIADLEEEYQMILFNSNATFRLVDVKMNEEITLIQLILSNESQIIKEKYINDSRRRIANISLDILFGQLMCDMGLWNESQHYLEYLFNSSQLNNEDLIRIEYSLGDVYQWKAEWYDARKYYDRAYAIIKNVQPKNIKESVYVLWNIGNIACEEGKYEEAYDYYRRALAFLKSNNTSKTTRRVLLLHDQFNSILSHIYRRTRVWSKFDNLLRRKQETTNIEFVSELSNKMKVDEIYREVLDYDWQQWCLANMNSSVLIGAILRNLLDSIDMATVLNNIGLALYEKADYDGALEYYRRALVIQEKYYQSPHIDIANSFNEIGLTLYAQKKYDEALEFYQQSLSIREKLDPVGNINMATVLNNIGLALYEKADYDGALEYYRKALVIQEKYYQSPDIDIANNFNRIGVTLY
ncbi:unnamed protein product, partial [Rotaria sp. Silwood1]